MVDAAEGSLADERHFFVEIPKVTSATRLSESVLNTPAAVTVIDRDLIEASTLLTVPELLRLVPGFQVAQATGAITTATRHGVADQLERRLEVLVNGNPVYTPVHASMEWNLLGIPLENIQRIEVVRSPNAPAFGGNAAFGSINIITREPVDLRGQYLRGTGGSIDTRIGVGRLGGRLGPMDAVATFQYNEDQGFEDVNDHRRMGTLRFHGTLALGANDLLSLEMGYADGETGADGEGTELFPFRDRRLLGSYQALTWRNGSPAAQGLRLAVSHQASREDDSYTVFVAPELSAQLGYFNSDSNRFDVEFEQWTRPIPSLRVLWGAGARYDRVASDLYLAGTDGEAAAWTGRVLGAVEWQPTSRVTLNLNALAEFSEVSDTQVSPRVGLNWRFAEGQALRLSAGRSYRLFSAAEQLVDYPVFLSDGSFFRQLFLSTGPDAAPEQVDSLELGYLFDRPMAGLSFDLSLFYERLKDAGAELRDPNRTLIWRDRGGGWITRGLEAQVRYQPTPATLLFGSYSWAKTDGSEPTKLDERGVMIDWQSLDDTTPEHTFALQASHRFGSGWRGTLALFHIGAMRWLGEGGPVDAYTRLDAKISKTIELSGAAVTLELIGQNLANNPYQEFRDDGVFKKAGNHFGRRAFLQVSVDIP